MTTTIARQSTCNFKDEESRVFFKLQESEARALSCTTPTIDRVFWTCNRINSIESLFFKKCSLTVLDTAIFGLPHLRELDLSNNQLKGMPSGQFPKLTHLNLRKNQLITFPKTHCPELKVLNLSKNAIKKIPKSTSNVPKLETLNLSSNFLEKGVLPKKISKLITSLDLSKNSITHIPGTMLRDLKFLAIEFNCIETLKTGRLKNMNRLMLRGNPLEKLKLNQFPNVQVISMSVHTFKENIKGIKKSTHLHLVVENFPISDKLLQELNDRKIIVIMK